MLNKDALKHIAESANIPGLIEQVNSLGSEVALLPKDYELISLEPFMPNRYRYAATMKTPVIDDFAHYVLENVSEKSGCFIDQERMTAGIIFDVGTADSPLHGEHKAYLTLKKTALFRELLGVNGKRFKQIELANWIEDFADYIRVADSNGEEMTALSAAASIRKMSVESLQKVESDVHDFGRKLSVSEQAEVKSEGKRPAAISFKCIPYNGLGERDFIMRVSANTGNNVPEMMLNIKQLEVIEEEIAIEFKGIIDAKLDDERIATFIGTFSL